MNTNAKMNKELRSWKGEIERDLSTLFLSYEYSCCIPEIRVISNTTSWADHVIVRRNIHQSAANNFVKDIWPSGVELIRSPLQISIWEKSMVTTGKNGKNSEICPRAKRKQPAVSLSQSIITQRGIFYIKYFVLSLARDPVLKGRGFISLKNAKQKEGASKVKG